MTKLLLSLMLVVAGAGLFMFRAQQREELQRIQRAEAAAQDAEARAANADLRSDKFKREMLRIQAEELLRPQATSPSSNAPVEHPAAKLLRDPEMRASMRKEHVRAVNRTVNRIVDSNLVALLNLTPEQTAALKDLVQKKHAAGVDLLMGLMTADASELPAIGHAAQQQKRDTDTEIRAFLGEEAYKAYYDYEDSLGERLRLAELRRKFDEAGVNINADQDAALLQAMVEERRNFSFTHDFNDPLNFDMNRLPEIFGEASLNQVINEMEQLNNRIIVRAQGLLDARQSAEFAQALRDHFEQSKMTVKMTAAMFPVGGRRSP